MKGAVAVVARGAASVNAAGSVSESLNPAIFSLAARVDGSGGLAGSPNGRNLLGGEIDGSAGAQAGFDTIVSFGGGSSFFGAGGLGASATILGGSLIVGVVATVGAAAGFFSGTLRVLAAAGAEIDGSGAISASTTATEAVAGSLSGAAGLSGDVLPAGHLQLVTGNISGSATILASPSVAERIAASTAATAGISTSIAVREAATGKTDASGAISSFANTAGIVAGEVDGAGNIAGDFSISSPSGNIWFLVGELDGEGGISTAPVVQAMAVGGILAADSTVTSGAVLGEWGFGRFTGEGGIIGGAFRLTPGTALLNAAAGVSSFANINANTSGTFAGAATVSSNATRVRLLAGTAAASGSISGKLAPISFASGNSSGAGNLQAGARLKVRVAGEVDGTAAVSANIAIRERLAGRIDGAGSISGNAITGQGGSFSTDFSADFNGGINPGQHFVSGSLNAIAGISGNVTLPATGRSFSADFSSDFR